MSNKCLTYVGEISYSIYLWHWPIIAFFRYYHNRYDLTLSELFLVISLTAITSLASYYLIEKSLRFSNGTKLYIPIGVMVIINVLMIYYVTPLKFHFSKIPLEYVYPTFGKESHGNDFKGVGVYGDRTYEEKRILFLGDSHALTFIPYMDTLGKKESILFRAITNDQYPTLPGLGQEEITEEWRLQIYEQLIPHIQREVDSADVIILCFTGDGAVYYRAINAFLGKLKKSQKVLFMADYPTLNVNPVRINRSHIRDVTKDFNYVKTATVFAPEISKLIHDHPSAKVVDLSSYKSFFDDAPFYNDTLVYYDGGHINHHGSVKYEELTGREFMKHLNWALGNQ